MFLSLNEELHSVTKEDVLTEVWSQVEPRRCEVLCLERVMKFRLSF